MMTNDAFRAWREATFPSVREAARALELDKDTIAALETGLSRAGRPRPIPRWVELMVAGWNSTHTETD